MTDAPSLAPHPLDHLVLPVGGLDEARARLGALGFIVAPTGVHPFGTVNCCVFLADGTYLEPLAVGNAGEARQAIASGNVFVGRDRLYRDSRGDNGFSAVVLGTTDALADNARYVEAGLSAGQILNFSRAFTDANGKSDTASFRLAFAGDGNPDAFLFACERINAPNVDRTALQAHGNGALGVVEIVAVSDAPSGQERLIHTATGAEPDGDRRPGIGFNLPNARLSVVEPAAFQARFCLSAGAPSKLRFAAVVFSVLSAAGTAKLLAAGAIEHDIRGSDVVVPPAPGQGAAFIFREMS